MPRFRVIHRSTGETWEVEASCADDARKMVGWPIVICRTFILERGPYANITPPKVAVQLIPPNSGSVHICPDCTVTMLETPDRDYWWQCPSCDQMYHELENKFFKEGEI